MICVRSSARPGPRHFCPTVLTTVLLPFSREPVRRRGVFTPYPNLNAMEDDINKSLEPGIICPSSSPAGAGFFFVEKKDKSLQPCIDYWRLNGIPLKNRNSLPLISLDFELLQGATVFSKQDNAYHLVLIWERNE